ncbi:MAG: hypothetical protein JWP89_3158 [Schlesneria sp.]|nr:hypothetical protein [Schlesneria sp.]
MAFCHMLAVHEIEGETSMGEWHRTTVLFTGLQNIERAVDYIADRNGFVKVDFDPRIVSPTTYNRLRYSEPQTATTWLLALQPKSDGVTIVKSFPFSLMSSSFSPAPTRPLLGTVCALLGCYGIYSSLEGGTASFFIAADDCGNCQTTGITLAEEDPIWVPALQWAAESPRQNETEAIKTALGRFGISLSQVPNAGGKLLVEYARLSNSEISDQLIFDVVVGKAPADCVVLAYQDRNSAD